MKLLFASVSLVLALGISKLSAGPVGAPAPSSSAVETSSAAAGDSDADSLACPFIWVCDGGATYRTRSACVAACSGTCASEPLCAPGCPCLQ